MRENHPARFRTEPIPAFTASQVASSFNAPSPPRRYGSATGAQRQSPPRCPRGEMPPGYSPAFHARFDSVGKNLSLPDPGITWCRIRLPGTPIGMCRVRWICTAMRRAVPLPPVGRHDFCFLHEQSWLEQRNDSTSDAPGLLRPHDKSTHDISLSPPMVFFIAWCAIWSADLSQGWPGQDHRCRFRKNPACLFTFRGTCDRPRVWALSRQRQIPATPFLSMSSRHPSESCPGRAGNSAQYRLDCPTLRRHAHRSASRGTAWVQARRPRLETRWHGLLGTRHLA